MYVACTSTRDDVILWYFVLFQDLSPDSVSSIILATRVPPFKPSSKVYTTATPCTLLTYYD